MTTASEYADKIMAEIAKDIADGTIPATVATFSELHDYVDANDYAQQAGVPTYVADAEDPWETVNAVEAEVDRRLRERAASRSEERGLCRHCGEQLVPGIGEEAEHWRTADSGRYFCRVSADALHHTQDDSKPYSL